MIWEQFLQDHPDLAKMAAESYSDPTYELSEKALSVSGNLSQKPDEIEIGDPELPPIVN